MRYFVLFLAFLVGCSANGIYWEPCKYGAKSDANKSYRGGQGKAMDANKSYSAHLHGGGQMLSLNGGEEKNVSVSYILPDLSSQEAKMRNNMITPKINMGGYYALTALRVDENGSDFAVRYISSNGKPVNVSPVKLINKQKNILEIIPNPLPREHDRYSSSKEYKFVVLYDKKPLEGAVATIKIGDKTQVLKSSSHGDFAVSLPNDFKDVKPEKRESKEFVLAVAKEEGGKVYTASFSAPYYPNPNDWHQSQSLGFAGILLGFLGGLAIYTRTKKGEQ